MFMFFWLTGKYCGGTPVVTEPWMVRLVLGSALFYAMCDCFRLARFNTMLEQPSLPYWKNFFTGVPAPGGCWMVLTPAVLSMALGGGEVARSAAFLQSPVFGIFMLLFVGALMASRIPTISLKSIRISRRYLMPVMAVLLLVVALLVTNFWMTIGTLGALYILTVPLSALAFVKVKLRYEAKEALTSDMDKGKI
jgi:CDP-diacylglycerol--serine O-phosphatidyltransferase